MSHIDDGCIDKAHIDGKEGTGGASTTTTMRGDDSVEDMETSYTPYAASVITFPPRTTSRQGGEGPTTHLALSTSPLSYRICPDETAGVPLPLLRRLRPRQGVGSPIARLALSTPPHHPTSSTMTTATPFRHQPFGTGVGVKSTRPHQRSGQLMSTRRLMIVKSRIPAV